MDFARILNAVMLVSGAIYAVISADSETRRARVGEAARVTVAAIESLTGKDLVNDEAAQAAAVEVYDAVFALKTVVESRPQAAA